MKRLAVDDKTHKRLKTMAKFNKRTYAGELYILVINAYAKRKTWRKVNERNATKSIRLDGKT